MLKPSPTMLTKAWEPLRPHLMQSKLWRTSERNVKVCAGRGSGKTMLARRRVVRYLRVDKPWADPKYFYALPTYNQCRRVAREQILSLIPRSWFTKIPGDSAMEFKFVFGSWLFLVGMDVPARIEGDQYDGGVVDESSDQKPGIMRTLLPALSHREGWLWRIGVPKRHGPGAIDYRGDFEAGVLGVDSFTWPSWDILPAEEIEKLKRELDEKDYEEQIGGTWVAAGGACYHAFSEANIDDTVEYEPTRMAYLGTDYNVDPMAWVLAHKSPKGFRVFDEIWLRNTNTERSLDLLYERYGDHAGGWTFCGDASSKNRHTSSSSTDYAQISHDHRFRARIRVDDSNPHVRDRVAAVNTLCRNKAGEHWLQINSRCQHLIADLRKRSLDEYGNPTAATPGQSHDSGHATDALGYLIWQYYPVKRFQEEGSQLVIAGRY